MILNVTDEEFTILTSALYSVNKLNEVGPESDWEENSVLSEKAEELADKLQKQSLEPYVDQYKKMYDIEHDKYIRLAADFQNYKRINDKRVETLSSQGDKDVILAILPFIDDLERSIEAGNKDNQLLLNKVLEGLKMRGLESYGEIGDIFNPDLHGCLALSHEDNIEDSVITQIFKKGYKLNGVIIRHAEVIVNKEN